VVRVNDGFTDDKLHVFLPFEVVQVYHEARTLPTGPKLTCDKLNSGAGRVFRTFFHRPRTLLWEAFVVKIRFVLVAALAASVALGTAGCNLIQPQATTTKYDPSDGVGIDVGDVALRNLILISDDGVTGQLMFDAINTTGADIDLNVSFTSNGTVTSQIVTIPSSDWPTSFGGRDEPQVQFTNFGVAPGGMLDVVFQAGASETKTIFVPVLTTQLPEYNGLTPTATPTPEPTLTPTATPATEDVVIVEEIPVVEETPAAQ
jgi:hypothetical protein